MSKFADHESYIAAAPEGHQPVLRHLRALLAAALPNAEEVIMYDMPGFRIGKSVVASYAAFSKQCGLYVSKGAIKAHADNLAAAGLRPTRTGVTFTPKEPIPDALVTSLADASRKDLEHQIS